MVGLPNWAKNQAYAVASKPAEGFPSLPPEENKEQVRLMMRAMLGDRFHLRVHAETRQEPLFKLEVARGGVRIKEVDPPVFPAKEGYVGAAMGDREGRLIGKKSTMSGLAAALSTFLERSVVDQTGLKGYYDFDVRWSVPEAPNGQTPSPRFGAEGAGLLITNLQSQFGLRLTKTAGPVKYWVVDHVDPPTDN
ncbi:MAG TPA: TIGR03435 family protein [Bryobacteraceae bacterium]|nr:TIGR03435 family protein [Bryobacteraceae bacterium]